MNFAIKTKKLGRMYKIRGGKKTEPKELIALDDVNIEVNPGEQPSFVFRWAEHRAVEQGLIDMVTN